MPQSTIITRMNSNDRAVSPVIGVILMVAITVILAAVIGTFVLDIGQSAGQTAPSASLQVTLDRTTDSVNMSHKGGDALNSGETRVVISNESWTVTYSANGNDAFSVGDEEGFGVAAQSTTWALTGSLDAGTPSIESGFQYNVQIIDTESQRVIYDTTVTA